MSKAIMAEIWKNPDLDLTALESALLIRLANYVPISAGAIRPSIKELAIQLKMARDEVTSSLESLETKGYIYRTDDFDTRKGAVYRINYANVCRNYHKQDEPRKDMPREKVIEVWRSKDYEEKVALYESAKQYHIGLEHTPIEKLNKGLKLLLLDILWEKRLI